MIYSIYNTLHELKGQYVGNKAVQSHVISLPVKSNKCDFTRIYNNGRETRVKNAIVLKKYGEGW